MLNESMSAEAANLKTSFSTGPIWNAHLHLIGHEFSWSTLGSGDLG